MLRCFVYALLMVNAFTAWAETCEDKVDPGFCSLMKERGQCQMGSYVTLSKNACAKTCEWCEPEQPPERTRAILDKDCKNELDGKICFELYEKGQCDFPEISQKLCRQICHTCH
uniref:ShKT domain-containing protein n=1 Tax=Haemonchus contortus TaxID=6289 RepID=A0A7I5EAV8_HAECO